MYLADCPRCEARIDESQAVERTNAGPLVSFRVRCECGGMFLIQTTRKMVERWAARPDKRASVPNPKRAAGRLVASFATVLDQVDTVDDIFEFSDPWYTSRAPKEKGIRW